MKVSGETILGGAGTNGYFKVRDFNSGSSQNNPIVEIDADKGKGNGSNTNATYKLLEVSGGYTANGLTMNRENKPYSGGTVNDLRVNLKTGGSLTVDGCHEDFAATSVSYTHLTLPTICSV